MSCGTNVRLAFAVNVILNISIIIICHVIVNFTQLIWPQQDIIYSYLLDTTSAACIAMLSQNVERPVCSIVGDPGKSSRGDRMFVVKVYYTNIPSSRLAAPGSPRMRMLWTANIGYQAPDVQTLDSFIHRRNHYPADTLLGNQLR